MELYDRRGEVVLTPNGYGIYMYRKDGMYAIKMFGGKVEYMESHDIKYLEKKDQFDALKDFVMEL